MTAGIKANADGSAAIQVGGSDAITITSALNTTFAGTVTSASTVAGSTGTLYPIVSGTSVSASGTSVNFTGIPSWVKRITVMFNGVSTNGASNVQVQLGSGSFTTSGYAGRIGYVLQAVGISVANLTSGLGLDNFASASETRTGIMTIDLITGNTFVSSCQVVSSSSLVIGYGGGTIALGGTLDRLRITTVNGTDTFDAGTINILYE